MSQNYCIGSIKHILPEVISVCHPLIITNETRNELVSNLKDVWGKIMGLPYTPSYSIDTFEESYSQFNISPEESIKSKKSVVTHPPKYKISNIDRLSSKKENGEYIGIYVTTTHIEVVWMKCFGQGHLNTRTTTYPVHSTYLPYRVAEVLSNFVDGNNLINRPCAVSVSAAFEDDNEFLPELEKYIEEYLNLKKVFVKHELINKTAALLTAGIYENASVKFAVSLGDNIEFAMWKQIESENGKKRRKILLVSEDQLFEESVTNLVVTVMDDPSYPEQMVSAAGIPEIVRCYLVAAIEKTGVLNGLVSPMLQLKRSISLTHVAALERRDEDDDIFLSCRRILALMGYSNVTNQDCIQVQFIIRSVVRRSCVLLAASMVAIAKRICADCAHFVVAGPLLCYEKYYFYLKNELEAMRPGWLQIFVTAKSRRDICIGSGLIVATDSHFLPREKARRTLPLYRKQCCQLGDACCSLGENCHQVFSSQNL